MPALGMVQETGKILRWLKAEGDPVEAGEIIMEIETDKAIVEIEAATAGTLAQVSAAEGDDVPVGQMVAYILAAGETVDQLERDPTPAPALDPAPPNGPDGSDIPIPISISPVAARIATEHKLDVATVRAAGGRVEKDDVLRHLEAQSLGPGRVLASPKARRLAAEQNVRLEGISGTGPGGAVLAADVMGPAQGGELSSLWRLMSDRVTQAWTQVPHFYLLREARAGRMMTWKEQVSRRTGTRLTYTDLLIKVVAESLAEHPNVNSVWEGDNILPLDEINVGIAVAVDDGLVVPVIHGVIEMSLDQIAQQRRGLIEKAQAGRLHLADVQGGSFTISNLGMFGVDAFTAILNTPQAAIMAVGRIADRVVVENGQPAVAPTVYLSLAFDHRVVDGARGAAFLQTLVGLIEEPLGLLE